MFAKYVEGLDAECKTLQKDIQLDEKKQHWGNKIATFKKCPAIIDLFRTGIILQLGKTYSLKQPLLTMTPPKKHC